MTSNNNEEPKTPHEEVMFVVESTNDIVSKILEMLKECCGHCSQDCKFGVLRER